MKKTCFIFSIISLLLTAAAFSQNNFTETYNNYVRDLQNVQTFGYKASLENGFDFSEGERIHCKGKFAIAGEGFFKLLGNDGKTYYTRNGNFTIKNNAYYLYGEYYSVQNFNGNINSAILYKPAAGAKIERKNSHADVFIFSDVVKADGKVCENQIELSNTNPLKVLDKMEMLLLQNRTEKENAGRLDAIKEIRKQIIFNELNKEKILTEYFNRPHIQKYLENDLQVYDYLKTQFWYKWLTESPYVLNYLRIEF